MTSKQVPIPGPRGVPFLGNIYDVEPEVPVNSFERLVDNYGTELHERDGMVFKWLTVIFI